MAVPNKRISDDRWDIDLNAKWKDLRKMLDRGFFMKELRPRVLEAGIENCKLVEARVKQDLGSPVLGSNKPLTVEMKQRNAPGRETGELANSVDYRIENWNRHRVGIFRDSVSPEIMMRAEIVHYGTAISVTEQMRTMFNVLADVADGLKTPDDLWGRARILHDAYPNVNWLPLQANTTYIIIEPREFLKRQFGSRLKLHQYMMNYRKAVVGAYYAASKTNDQLKWFGM